MKTGLDISFKLFLDNMKKYQSLLPCKSDTSTIVLASASVAESKIKVIFHLHWE